MTRPHALLHPQREPAPLWQAATVLLLRDAPASATEAGSIEVLMTRRSLKASFAPGAYVFPGGGIEASDREAADVANRRATQSDTQLTQAVAAIRETWEELGVLLLAGRDLPRVTEGDPRQVLNDELQKASEPVFSPKDFSRAEPFLPQVRAKGARLSTDGIFTLALWTTDRDLPRRFEVPFLVARMPQGQTPVADESEQFEPLWVSPQAALARHAAGDFFIIFPTIRTLERLQAFTSVDAVLAACQSEQPLWASCPRAGFLNGAETRFMEHEAPYGELELVSPDGQIVHELAFQSEKPVPLLRHVQRLTAPNPSFMTGPGTNSYVVGTPATGFVVIDPGPPVQEHVERLFVATQGRINAIVCTHSHADHSPAAPLLQALCVARGLPRPPICGVPSAATARKGSEFTPNCVLQNKEQTKAVDVGQSAKNTAFSFEGDILQGRRVVVGGDVASGSAHNTVFAGLGFTLRTLHTPGHAANHICLVLEEDGILFSGDHVLNGSTTVIDPPDGHLGDYLQSLDLLAAACDEFNIIHILPAHGHVLGNSALPAKWHIEQLKAHRLRRHDKVAAAMRANPHADAQALLPLVYGDVDSRLWPVAARSLAAHMQHEQRTQTGAVS